MSSLDYIDLKHLDTATTVDGYQLEKYQHNDEYALLLRDQRFGTVKTETTVQNEADAQQILETSKEEPIKQVLEQ